jgi:hypothetical protein
VGRYLYQLDAPWVDVEKRGNSVVMPAKSEEQLRRWLAGWMRANGHGALVTEVPPEAPAKPAARQEPPPAPAKAPPPKAAPKPAAATAKPSGHVTEPDAEPVTAATLLDGTPHRPGLRSICERIKATRDRLKTGHPVADDQTVYALNDAYDAWESWRRAVHPKLPEAEQAKLGTALAAYEKLAKSLDDAARKAERTAQAKAAGADPETGEVLEYEQPGEAA